MKTFTHAGVNFGVQAYLKNDFVNICPLVTSTPYRNFDEELWAIKIEWHKGTSKVTHGGKDNTAMKKLLQEIQPLEVKEIVDKIFA